MLSRAFGSFRKDNYQRGTGCNCFCIAKRRIPPGELSNEQLKAAKDTLDHNEEVFCSRQEDIVRCSFLEIENI